MTKSFSSHAVFLSILCAACGSPAASPRAVRAARAPAPRSERPAPPPACRIEAVHGEALTVSVEGADAFDVSIVDGSLTFAPGAEARELTAEVDQPLRFRARARVDGQRLVLAEESELAAGAVHVAAGAEVVAIERAPRGFAVELRIGRPAPTAMHGVSINVGPIAVPCEAVAAIADGSDLRATSVAPIAGAELRVASSVPLLLRPVRIAPSEIAVRPSHRDPFLPVWVLDRQSGSARVAIAFSDGSRIEGWALLHMLREPNDREAEYAAELAREPAAGDPLPPLAAALETPPIIAQADEYVGPATLRGQSEVFASEGGPRWARAAEVAIEVRVRWPRGSAFAELIEVPGVWLPRDRAWVRRADLSLP